ncbi:putative deferrochelatase/peroxidase [Escovopsis weberi]|uniref:Putative deferrochelatase/peroxidase n=1 Tax=Escovopsis weberi TaxID=150374 RepID=A0A0M8MYS5_ESCWE|nr:putative deferrochelatase/peroxidase [Escovopsis weberi]
MNCTQAFEAPLTNSATFLVLAIRDYPLALKKVRTTLAGIGGIIKGVAFRDARCPFYCTVGIGSRAWDPLTGHLPRPAELHPLREIRGPVHRAPSTPGDLLLHIRSDRRDLCFEFERQVMAHLQGAVDVVDATQGFRYFDARDLLGFVDGAANPAGAELRAAALVSAADEGEGEHAVSGGGSYVLVQKYVHDMASWRALPTEAQEAIVGRTKLDNAELGDAEGGAQKSHKTLTTVEDARGAEHAVVRDNMPFGSPAEGVYGTYFIGHARRLWVLERMLERMFVGDPPGKHDRILDYSRPTTGTVFFAPSDAVLAGLGA